MDDVILVAVLVLIGTALLLAVWIFVERARRSRVLVQMDELRRQVAKEREAIEVELASARLRGEQIVEEAVAKAKLEEEEAKEAVAAARERGRRLNLEAEAAIASATSRSAAIIANAEEQAKRVAGHAYDALKNAAIYRETAQAMQNLIEGYGDDYLVPPRSLLDGLADHFSHKDAGVRLKQARDHTRSIVREGLAAKCDYIEPERRETASRFVLDAFNGKVDSILSRVKEDNHGTLGQEINDAFAIVNQHGRAFRNARITAEYLSARREELRWGAVAFQLKLEEQEEQRRIREKIRDEEKARREYERAIKETAKEEEVLRKAMAKAEAQIAQATAEQRSKYELQLQELTAKLKEAEDRNQRAVSMAQQTRRGHVYIISNVGSFGEHVYKIGLTRRLDPQERIWELGDSSVPFEFDIHAFIFSEDAPSLEHKLHKHFVLNQVNKVNHRKEFFRASLADIRRELEALGVEVSWTMVAEAHEFRETQAIEKRIKDDPAAREAWVNRQLELDPLDFMNADRELVGTES